MWRRRVNALNGLRRPLHEAPLTVQFHVRLGPDLDVHANSCGGACQSSLRASFLVDQPVRLDLLQDRGGDFFDGLGRGRQPTDA